MKILDYLKEHVVRLDGGMGTLLQAEGLAPGESPERWNLTHAEAVRRIHRAYYEAGSHVVSTNTFGANRLHFEEAELEQIIEAAVANAKAARASSGGDHPKFVALDIGPTGRLLRPFGDLDFEDAVSIFAQVVRIGARFGVDLILIETMNDCYETKAALLAAKENSDLPVFVSNAYGADGKLMTGATPSAMAAMLEGMHADAIGVNCSLGPAQLVPVAEELLRTCSVPVFFKPNAGLPKEVDGKTVYDVTPQAFAEAIKPLVARGVRAVGGCCGTTPAYIRALTGAVDGMSPVPIEPRRDTVISSYAQTVTLGDVPILIGERINPTGKKRFKQALLENDMDYILNEGINQEACGVQVLDVNVGLPDIDECEMLCRAMCELQGVLPLPLQLDTSNPVAMERALRRYNGKAMVNSVNGKEESMHAIFPLVRKYGGVVVALTLDENGIPGDAQGRLRIAERILSVAEDYGIEPKDIVFDTLAMTVSAEPAAPRVTLDALRLIRERLHCHTSLGVSNVSFGLPGRDAVNGTFFVQALEAGLSAAIMNPYSVQMQRAYRTWLLLQGKDANCAEYIRFCEQHTEEAPAARGGTAPAADTVETGSALQRAIRHGLKEQAATLTQALLGATDSLTIVQKEIIPALDAVGVGYEKGSVYLPSLLMSAEAAKASFEQIRIFVSTHREARPSSKFPIVIATVQGDIHDIGKNIVKLLLENYGYDVLDLGKDVPPERIVEAVKQTKAPMVALSALMTTTVPAMEETIALLRREAPGCRVMVGGAVLNEAYAARIGADDYAKDAMAAVRCAEALPVGRQA